MDLFNSWIVEKYIAHRGLHNKEFPENSLGAFSNAILNDYPIELDVHIIKDGTIVVFHDETLSRVVQKDGYVKNLNKEDLTNCHLNGTEYTIPTFEDVLSLVNGQVPILIEIKNVGKVGELEGKLYKMLKNYNGEYAIQSFNPYVLEWFKKNAKEVLRGQLAGFFKGEKLSYLKKFVLKRMILNKKIACPDFISYDIRNLPNRFVKRYNNLPLLGWCCKSQEQYMEKVKYLDNIIFEGFEPKI